MTQKVQILLVDDIDGGEAHETVQFGLDGIPYEIDLREDNAERLRQALGSYIERARKTKSAPVVAAARRVGTRNGVSAEQRERTASIRQWAREVGLEVNERGRVPIAIIEKYDAAH